MELKVWRDGEPDPRQPPIVQRTQATTTATTLAGRRVTVLRA